MYMRLPSSLRSVDDLLAERGIDTWHDELTVERKGIRYPAYPVGAQVRYVSGLDGYVAGDEMDVCIGSLFTYGSAPDAAFWCRGG